MKLKSLKSGIYCIENIINNKKYIGSSKNLIQRKGQHTYQLKTASHPNKHLNSSCQKYGQEKFKFYILESCTNCDDMILKILEQKWIDRLDTCNREKGYNKKKDVIRGSGFKHSEESKRKMSESKKGSKPNVSIEMKERQVEHIRKKIYQYDINNSFIKEFNSIQEAVDTLKIDRGSISKAANPSECNKTAGGFIWKFEKTDKIKLFTRWVGRPIICNETEEIFSCMKDCSEKTGIKENYISNSIKKGIYIQNKYTFSRYI